MEEILFLIFIFVFVFGLCRKTRSEKMYWDSYGPSRHPLTLEQPCIRKPTDTLTRTL